MWRAEGFLRLHSTDDVHQELVPLHAPEVAYDLQPAHLNLVQALPGTPRTRDGTGTQYVICGGRDLSVPQRLGLERYKLWNQFLEPLCAEASFDLHAAVTGRRFESDGKF